MVSWLAYVGVGRLLVHHEALDGLDVVAGTLLRRCFRGLSFLGVQVRLAADCRELMLVLR